VKREAVVKNIKLSQYPGLSACRWRYATMMGRYAAMNIEKLHYSAGGPSSMFDYQREVVTRLEDALGSELDLNQSLMLMEILTSCTFVYDDGFIINDERDLIRGIGYSDAAAIVATFWDEPEYDFQWFKAEYFSDYSFSVGKAELRRIRDELLAAILHNPTVQLWDYANEENPPPSKRKTPES
jgi:hypothetical protein